MFLIRQWLSRISEKYRSIRSKGQNFMKLLNKGLRSYMIFWTNIDMDSGYDSQY